MDFAGTAYPQQASVKGYPLACGSSWFKAHSTRQTKALKDYRFGDLLVWSSSRGWESSKLRASMGVIPGEGTLGKIRFFWSI